MVLLVLGAGAWIAVQRIGGDIERIPGVFDRIPPDERPDKPAAGEAGAEAITLLLAGVDSRSDAPTTGGASQVSPVVDPGGARTDIVMVVHITGDRRSAYVVSIPGDSYVPIPGHGRDTIEAAFTSGGPSLYVRTVEQLTGLRIDHLAVMDWSGFATLTDALGGVRLTLAEPVTARGLELPSGTHLLSGEQALAYVGERTPAPRRGAVRTERQQEFLRALASALLSADVLTDPGRLSEILAVLRQSLSVDDELSDTELVRLALSLRRIRFSDVTFVTVPTDGVRTVGVGSIVVYDDARADPLWDAVRTDALPSYLSSVGRGLTTRAPALE